MNLSDFLKEKKTKYKLIFLILLGSLLAVSTYTVASYIHKGLLNTYFASAEENFYFTSNLLNDREEIPVYQISHDWQASSTATISFELRNYENPLCISNREIAYTVNAGTAGGTQSGTIAANGSEGNNKTIELSVTKPASADPFEPLEVLVAASATSPYSKTLQGTFIISPAISYQMEENAGSPVANLTITMAQSTELTKTVLVSWPAGAAPDMTNPVVIAAIEGETIDLTNRTLTTLLNTAAVYELVFFKDEAETDYAGVTVTGL